MAGRLLFVILIYSFHEIQAQAPPKLTVNPPVIIETDSVTLNCQTPSSVSVSQCYFNIVSEEPAKMFSCLRTLRGTELLKMSHQTSPAEVKVTCFYLKGSQSPDSDISSITIRTSLPPKLTVNPPVIKETDSVTLNCQTPSSVSVSKCFINILSGGNIGDSSCLQTLTGTELLKMISRTQSSSAELQVMCFYTVKLGETDSPSPLSGISSITIHNIVERQSSRATTKSAFSMTTASTFVTPVRPASDTEEKETCMTQTKPTFTTTTETWTLKLVVLMCGFGVIVGVVLLGLALLCTRRRTERRSHGGTQANVTDDVMCMRNLYHGRLYFPGGYGETYSIVTYEFSNIGKCVCPRPKANVTAKSKYGCGYMGRLNSGEYFPGCYGETFSVVTYEFNNSE